MSIITLPYTFVGGTRAIADQVNADFNAVANGVNNNVVTQLQNNPTNFYVNDNTGNDSNDGFTPNTAFKTLQGASNVVGFLNLNGVQVIVNIAPGSYSGFAWGGALLGQYSPQQVIFRGDTTTPSNVTVTGGTAGAGNGQCVFVISGGMIQLEGMRFTNPTGDANGFTGNAIWAQDNSQVNWQLCDFGPCSANGGHINVRGFSTASAVGPYTISGGAYYHYFAFNQGQINAGTIFGQTQPLPQFTITVNNTPAFGQFIRCSACSLAVFGAVATPAPIFAGNATGQRYSVERLSLLHTHNAGINYFPGNTPGTADATTFGLYT